MSHFRVRLKRIIYKEEKSVNVIPWGYIGSWIQLFIYMYFQLSVTTWHSPSPLKPENTAFKSGGDSSVVVNFTNDGVWYVVLGKQSTIYPSKFSQQIIKVFVIFTNNATIFNYFYFQSKPLEIYSKHKGQAWLSFSLSTESRSMAILIMRNYSPIMVTHLKSLPCIFEVPLNTWSYILYTFF